MPEPTIQDAMSELLAALQEAISGMENLEAQANLCLIHLPVNERGKEWFRKEVGIVANNAVVEARRVLAGLGE